MKKTILLAMLLTASLSVLAYDYPGRLSASQLQRRFSTQSYYDTDKFRHQEMMEQLKRQNDLLEQQIKMGENGGVDEEHSPEFRKWLDGRPLK